MTLRSRPSRGIKDFLIKGETGSEELNIFNFTSSNPTEFEVHNKFKQYANKVILEVATKELDYDEGDIITTHSFDTLNGDDLNYLASIKTKYTELYLSDLPETNARNKQRNKYPRFNEDLFSRNKKMYEQYEKEIDIKPIEEQSDDEIWGTLGKRIEGLKQCFNDSFQTQQRKEYYENELHREKALYESLNSQNESSIREKINKFCSEVKWHPRSLSRSHSEFNIEDFEIFIRKDGNKELELLTTFLDEKYFVKEQDAITGYTKITGLNKDIFLEDLYNNRLQHQYLFGFGDELRESFPFRPFIYEVQNMLPAQDYKHNCNKLVNWSIFLNQLYDQCAISNSNVIFPSRFILPSHEFSLIDVQHPEKGIKIRNIKMQLDLFDPSKTRFVGLVIIKNYKPSNTDRISIQKRLMILYIFQNLDMNHWDRFDTLTGTISDYFAVNNYMRFINNGMLIPHPNITFIELRHFMKLSKAVPPKIFTYSFTKYPRILFFSNKEIDYDIMSKFYNNGLVLQKVHISEDDKQNFLINSEPLQIGGNILPNTLMKYSNIIQSLHPIIKYTKSSDNLYFADSKISGIYYNKFLELVDKTIEYWYNNREEYNNKYVHISRILYEYLLVDDYELNVFQYNFIKVHKSVTKYQPLSPKYYNSMELLNKFNIMKTLKNTATILCVSNLFSFAEYIKFNNTKISNIKQIIPQSPVKLNIEKYINNFKSIYGFDVKFFDNVIYDILEQTPLHNDDKLDLVVYSVMDFGGQLFMFENYVNIPNVFVGALFGLKSTKQGGDFILDFGSVAYKHMADIYLIISKYFNTSNLYYPEVSNLFKKTGTYGVFQNFKGIRDDELENLYTILKDIRKLYPTGADSFNVFDTELRNKYKINKSIDNITKAHQKYISDFLDDGISNNLISKINTIYEYIKNFNESRYLKQYMYMTKFFELFNLSIKELVNVPVPTNDQISNAIIYCQKWNIQYWDKYSSKVFQDKFGKIVLSETFGIHRPIMFSFKTPFKMHNVNTVSLRLYSRTHSNASRIISSIPKNTKQSIKNIDANPSKDSKLISKKNKISKTVYDFLEGIQLGKSFHDISFKSQRSNTLKHRKNVKTRKNYNRMISLLPELEYIFTRIIQTGHLIDSRRDFTKSLQLDSDKDNLQLMKWYEVNKHFRYYKHKDDIEKMHLDQLVRKRLKDDTISQAWLKMYEIITDCHLVPNHPPKHTTFHSFHIAEAPGTFINALNNYIRTKTTYTDFEWDAQSLHTKGTRIGDQFGLIKRHPQRWDWGATGDGDITSIRNIKYYKQRVSSRPRISLMTSDAGLAMKESGYEKVAFASLLAILDILPSGASMVYKILTPIDEPLILNLIYVAYCNFKELIFYKPVQNNQSREFYIIGKGYLGTDSTILEAFYDELKKFKEGSGRDLFRDKYPEAFVRQFVAVSTELADNYCYTIERNIYYLDNLEHITPEFKKMAKDYYDEKNHDWLDKYQPRRIENEVDRL